MNCPYCGQMMEHGTLCANGNIRFLPDGVKDPLFFNRDEYEDRGAVLFPPYWDDKRLFRRGTTSAHICRDCEKMLVEVPED